MMSPKIRILIVDDHEQVRNGLCKLLSREEDMEIVAESTNGKEALADAATYLPDIILMDAKMPMSDGLQATNAISEKGVSCKIIMLTMFEEYLDEAMKNGARGYLLKGIDIHYLSDTIRSVHEGNIVIDERIGTAV